MSSVFVALSVDYGEEIDPGDGWVSSATDSFNEAGIKDLRPENIQTMVDLGICIDWAKKWSGLSLFYGCSLLGTGNLNHCD
uniref:Uncharacterized protein n=1 Tax=Cannabis sativa TaxID=3483 RepID=A0A803QNV7_CANSA